MTPPTKKSSTTPNTATTKPSQPAGLAIVLVEPRIPQNTGNIARLCACTGAELYLIGSLGFRLGNKYLERAGMDYIDDVEIHHLPDWPDLLAAKPGWTPYFIDTYGGKSHTEITYPENTLLVFGSETHGLPKWLWEDYPEQCLRIPMLEGARSLNLSNAVAVVTYEVVRQRGIPV